MNGIHFGYKHRFKIDKQYLQNFKIRHKVISKSTPNS